MADNKEGGIVKKGHDDGMKMAVGLLQELEPTWSKSETDQKLKGDKAKELMLWPPVNEITIDDKQLGKIHFKSLAGMTKTFPVEGFAACQFGHILLGSDLG
ncbi:Detected protein of unknown function [Hibiscus syriacus]|uniref:Uncharacterized protein n=1 Tax=Hibiscus syriacus TaxID=106335 RepID=A0A6A3AS77_HIBSY|nr:Detected protein of unknown function [Hibiscus syriacus]